MSKIISNVASVEIAETPAIGAAMGRYIKPETKAEKPERVHPEEEEASINETHIKEFLIFVCCAVVIYAVIELLGKTRKTAKRRRSTA